MNIDIEKYRNEINRNDSGTLSHGSSVNIIEALEQLQAEIERADKRLINAFQLIKNGRQITYLKYDAFKISMDMNHDADGRPIPTPIPKPPEQ